MSDQLWVLARPDYAPYARAARRARAAAFQAAWRRLGDALARLLAVRRRAGPQTRRLAN